VARLDMYVRSLERFGAAAVVLKSGQHVMLRFPTGDRHATQTLTHEQLVALVGEAAPASQRVAINAGRPSVFEHETLGVRYRVSVTPEGATWTVLVEPAAGARSPTEPSPPSPGAGASFQRTQPIFGGQPDALAIERTAHAPVVEAPAPAEIPIERHTYSAPAAPSLAAPPAPSAAARSAAAAPGDGLMSRMLVRMKELGASDLHLSSGNVPMVRLHGQIEPLEGFGALGEAQLHEQLMSITPEENRQEFADSNDTDFAHAIPGVSRFRANLFRDRRGVGAVFRAIPFEMPSAAQLGLPEKMLELCYLSKGLVLVTGPTGSGKSTTLAALIDHINNVRNAHIITIEDPIEFIHENKKCLVNQREVRSHTRSFKAALRAALREDPDIVLVGELRDLETIAIAVETAETGHLVFGTLHTSTAPSTVDRMIDQFPPDQQEQIRTMLAESLQGVIAQVLCRKVSGGRVAAYEILLGSSAVANVIREKKTFQLFSIMQTGRTQGMVTMNDSLIELVRQGTVEPREAYLKAVNKAEFRNLLQRAGVTL
jgi:twitching motility protein PilT